MTADLRVRHETAVELLDRALAYTRGALVAVRAEHLGRRTPCARWDLDALLAHMDDALDAFTEGAAGTIRPDGAGPRTTVATRVSTLQVKACGLLSAWSDPGVAPRARVGDAELDTTHLALVAALEIAVHGWDVAQATGAGTPVPADLARRLRPVAVQLIGAAGRHPSFGPPVLPPVAATTGEALLAFLGRRSHPSASPRPSPVPADCRVRRTH